MPPISDPDAWQSRLAALPLESYGAGDTVFAEGTKTGRLLNSKSGAVSILKSGRVIAEVAEPGAVLGELSACSIAAWRGRAHVGAVRIYVADAASWLQDPAALLYVTMVLARRIDAANRGLLELKSQLEAGKAAKPDRPARSAGSRGSLGSIGAGHIRAGAGVAGYPFP